MGDSQYPSGDERLDPDERAIAEVSICSGSRCAEYASTSGGGVFGGESTAPPTLK